MRYPKALITAITALALSPWSTLPAQTLVGKWLGESSPQGHVRCWVNHRRDDGTYELNFLETSPSGERRHREEGIWLMGNGVYATLTQRINGAAVDAKDKSYREFYRIEVLDDRQFVYTEVASGVQFRVRKMPDYFVIGDRCPAREG